MASPLKEPPLRLPGQSLDQKLHDILDSKVLLYAAVLGFSLAIVSYQWMIYLFDIPIKPVFNTFLFSIPIAFSAYKLYKIKPELLKIKQGRDGERVVGQLLEELRADGAVIFHDVDTGRGNIDHIIISPKGIFTVETKTWSKHRSTDRITVKNNTVIINGYPIDTNLINQSKSEAHWLSELLKSRVGNNITVRPIILFPGWYVESSATRLLLKQEKVLLLSAKAVIGYLSAFDPVLKEEEVQSIRAIIERDLKDTNRAKSNN